jgi:hypothetical protein
MKRGLQAPGRLKVGAINKTEEAYAATLAQRQHAGEVAWFKFEGMKFRLAGNTVYTPDFAVMLESGTLEMHEVKGLPARRRQGEDQDCRRPIPNALLGHQGEA